MKLKLKKPQKLRKRHILAISISGLLVVGVAGFVLLKTQIARSAIASDDKFRVVMPSVFSSSRGAAAYLEVGQTGQGNTLDAETSWSKYYIEEDRVRDATIGIYRGGYGGEVDSLGFTGGTAGQRLSDVNAVKFDFFLARNASVRGINEELPCQKAIPTPGEPFESSLTVNSGEMSVDGWYKIDAARFLDNATCNGARWDKTLKTGKYVLFMRAKWATPAPTVNGQKQGRINAFKTGAAYANSSNNLDNPLTGYWSDFDSATNLDNPDETPTRAAYSIQDRLSPDNTNGSYTFQFAPDCRIPRGGREDRLLHWKDVDYPKYYQAPWPVQPAPDFKLYEITPSGARSEVQIKQSDKKFNGSGQNVHGSVRVTFKGGHKYEWVWTNVARVDGVSFWLPYDDYPALAGCGSYGHSIGLWGSRGSGWTQSNFSATGGDTLQFLVDEKNTGGSGQAPDTTTNAYLQSQGGATYAGTFLDPGGATGISDNGRRVGRAQVEWTLPGMGSGPPYTTQRWLLFSYPIKADAQNGAVHCFNATMAPKSSQDPLGILTSNTICVTIDNSLKPYITTSGADVHAGDCKYVKPGQSVGKITGLVNGLNQGSSGQYIVSAADKITDFGSGGSPNGSALTFGKGGFYGSMCRPLMSDVDPTKEKGVEVVDGYSVAGPFDLGSLAPGKRYVVKFNGSGEVKGTARASVTVYAPNGTVTIKSAGGSSFGSDVVGKYDKKQLPTVGITAKHIKIDNAVQNVTAALYASGNITTCSENSVAGCRSSLLLNGYMMAYDFSLNRTGTGTNGLQIAENIKFNPAFYLNPSPGNGIPAGLAQYLGERAPLY